MSIQALFWAFSQPVFPSSRKFVLVALANFASERGLSYPGVPTIAELTCQKDDTIRTAIQSLLDEGIISDTGKRAGDTKQIRVFQLPINACSKTPENGGVKEGDKVGERPPKDPPKTPENGEAANIGTGTGTRTKRKIKEASPFPDIPEILSSESFKASWASWLDHRKEKKNPVTPRAAKLQLALLEEMGADKAVLSINNSIMNGWAGLFSPNGNGKHEKPKQRYCDPNI